MKKIAFYLIVVFIIQSCNYKNHLITITSEETQDSIYYPKFGKENSIPNKFVFVKEGENIYKIEISYKNMTLFGPYILDHENNVKQLGMKTKTYSQIKDVKYINKDSIILIYDRYFIDSCVVIVDINNNIKRVSQAKSPYTITSKSGWDNKESTKVMISTINSKPIYINNNIFLSTYLPNSNKFGTKEFCKRKYPLIAYFDLKKDTIIMNTDLWYPYLKEGVYYPDGAKYISTCLSSEENIIIGFSYTPLLYEWDYKTNKITEHKIASQLVDTIKPIKNPTESQFDKDNPYYSNLFYIDSLEMYVRYIFFPKEKYGDFRNIAVFADKDFNYLGEAYNTYFMIGEKQKVENNGLGTWGFQNDINNWQYSEYEDSIKLVKVKYEFGDLDINKIKQKMQSELSKTKKKKEEEFCSIMGNSNFKFDKYSNKIMLNYLNKIFDSKDSTFATFIVNDGGCHSCNDYILEFLQYNTSVVNVTKARLLFTGENIDLFNKKIEEFNLKGIKLLKIETNKIYNELHPFDNFNPRLILVKDNKIIKDTIYMPDNMQKMTEDYINFYDFDAE